MFFRKFTGRDAFNERECLFFNHLLFHDRNCLSEYHLHDPSIGANYISYRDYRTLTGADIQLFPFVKLGISGGYAFARKFVFYERNRNDVNLDGAPFGRLDVMFTW